MKQGLDGFLHKRRLIEYDRRLQLFRNIVEMRNRIANALNYRDRVGISALLHNRQIDRPLTIDAHHVVLDLVGVLRLANVAYRDP